jgi:hypothetical protein
MSIYSMSLQVHLVFQGLLTDITPERLPSINVSQVRSTKMLTESAWVVECEYATLCRQLLVAQANETYQ